VVLAFPDDYTPTSTSLIGARPQGFVRAVFGRRQGNRSQGELLQLALQRVHASAFWSLGTGREDGPLLRKKTVVSVAAASPA